MSAVSPRAFVQASPTVSSERHGVVRSHLSATRRLVVLGILITQWSAIGFHRPESADYLRWSVWFVAVAAVGGMTHLWAGWRSLTEATQVRFMTAALVSVGAWPIVCRFAQIPDVPLSAIAPWEVAISRALVGVTVAAAAGATTMRLARLAAASSLFLVLYSHAYGDVSIPALRVLVTIYAALGALWLMVDYDARRTALASIERKRPTIWRRWSLVGGLAAVVVIGGGVTTTPSGRQIGSWFASSGGSHRADPTARSGRQDGNGSSFRSDQVPDSIGFSESERYADSPRPSLYDVYNEQFGEPVPTVTAGRAKVLQAEMVQTGRRQPAASFEAERRVFETARRSPPKNDPYAERNGTAHCLVEGPAPLHLRWRVYDRFDGRVWHEARQTAPTDAIRPTGDGTWMARSAAEKSGRDVSVVVKVVNLTTNTVPTPVNPAEFRCGAIDQSDYFAWHDDGVLGMRYQKFLPPGAMFEFRTVQPDDEVRATAQFTAKPEVAAAARRPGDDPRVDAKLRTMIDVWTSQAVGGREKISAICEGLKRLAVVDRTAVVPEAVTDSTVYFVLLGRRGPDYLFASSAADLLARLGYRTRFVSGFYADAASYDDTTDQYALHDEHLHSWAEVQDDGGRWHVIEATPGYEVLRPALPWYERWAQKALVLQAELVEHAIPLAGFIVVLGLFLIFRHRLQDLAATAYWHLAGSRSEQRARDCLRIIVRRASAVGLARLPGETASRFVVRLAQDHDSCSADHLRRIAAVAERVRFASLKGSSERGSEQVTMELEGTCRAAIEYWTMRRLRPQRPPRHWLKRIRNRSSHGNDGCGAR
jgi:hypothetical protein